MLAAVARTQHGGSAGRPDGPPAPAAGVASSRPAPRGVRVALRPRPRQHLQHERVVRRRAVRVRAVRPAPEQQGVRPLRPARGARGIRVAHRGVRVGQVPGRLGPAVGILRGSTPRRGAAIPAVSLRVASRRPGARRAARPPAAGPARPSPVVPAADAEAPAGLLEGGGGDSDYAGRVRQRQAAEGVEQRERDDDGRRQRPTD